MGCGVCDGDDGMMAEIFIDGITTSSHCTAAACTGVDNEEGGRRDATATDRRPADAGNRPHYDIYILKTGSRPHHKEKAA